MWATRHLETNVARSGSPAVGTPEAEPYARLYLIAVRTGTAPALDDFLREVPEELRESVFERIDRALANPKTDADPPASREEPSRHPAAPPEAILRVDVAPAAVEPRGLAIRCLARLVPGYLREEFVGSLLVLRRESREAGDPPLRRALATAKEFAAGIVQRAPLAAIPPEPARPKQDRFSVAGRTVWRVAGPLPLLGYALGSLLPVFAGIAALGFSLGCVVRAASRRKWETEPDAVRLVNGVLGSLVLILVAGVLLATFAGGLLALGSTLSLGWLAAGALHAFFSAFLGIVAITGASGWVPQPWTSRRLVRVRLDK